MKLHLYEFYLDDGTNPDSKVLVISSKNSEQVRLFGQSKSWDHGGYDPYIFRCVFEDGEVREVTSLEDDIQDVIPYETDEKVFCEELGGDFLDLDTDVQGFFEEYYGKEYPDQ